MEYHTACMAVCQGENEISAVSPDGRNCSVGYAWNIHLLDLTKERNIIERKRFCRSIRIWSSDTVQWFEEDTVERLVTGCPRTNPSID